MRNCTCRSTILYVSNVQGSVKIAAQKRQILYLSHTDTEREREVDILAVLAYEGWAEPISTTAKSEIFYIYSFVTPVNTDSTALGPIEPYF